MKVCVLGAGKMGSWLAAELAKEHDVAVYDREKEKARSISNVMAIESLEQLPEFSPEILVNAVSLENTIKAFKEVSGFLPKKCVLVDIASIKGGLPSYYSGSGFRFASLHPMFGPTFARMNMLAGQNAVIMKESDGETADFFRQFFKGLGLNIFEYTFEEHDRIMAYSLTTPFIASLVFASCVDNSAVPGTTFANHMKIARGLLAEDDNLLAEVLFNPHSVPQLEKITAKLEFLKHVIRQGDREEASKLFSRLRNNVGNRED